MKSKFLLFALSALSVLLITGCSSINQASKTPDDVYYSPARAVPPPPPNKAYKDEYDEYISSSDDRYLQMKVQNRQLWSSLDDYSYWNDPTYTLNYSYYYGSPYYNNYLYSGYYNPYSSIYGLGYFDPFYSPGYGYGYGSGYGYHGSYLPAVVVTKNPLVRVTAARPSLNTYNRPQTYYVDPNSPHSRPTSIYNNNNNNSRTIPNNPSPAPVRTYSPPPSSSGGGGGGGGVSRPVRRG